MNDVEQQDKSASGAAHPSSGLNTRPAWTWDWNLPNMTQMSLRGEVAFRFQFKMLDKTPSLQYLSVNIESWSEDHERVVELTDLIKPGSQHPSLLYFLVLEQNRSHDKIYI
ncbi:hypothetical protein FBU30_007236 [Linnemannia zychae]|nr:hypothetical protein FBU30_007236 [Linnemannia zychae]